jgi:hypothetical protein
VEKTAFVRKFRKYEFRRAMFGMRNLPGLWRRLADLVFRGLTWKIRVVFFDPKLARRNSYQPSLHTKALSLSSLPQYLSGDTRKGCPLQWNT